MIRVGFKNMSAFEGFQVFRDDEMTNISFSLSFEELPSGFNEVHAFNLIKEALYCYLTGYEPSDPEFYEYCFQTFEYEEFTLGEDFVSLEAK